MTEVERTAVLLTLLEKLGSHGSWCGETHLQKAMYFLQELTGVPAGYNFILYKHGPFSFDHSNDASRMLAEDLLKLEPRLPGYGPSIVPTELGRSLGAALAGATSQFAPQLDFVAQRLAARNVVDLERLATALFVSGRLLPNEDLERQAEEINRLKPHITLQQARSALETVDSLQREVAEKGLRLTTA